MSTMYPARLQAALRGVEVRACFLGHVTSGADDLASYRSPRPMAVPILYSTDLDRTTSYYRSLGLEVVERQDTYLVMHTGPVQLHFTSGHHTPAPGQTFLHVRDAGRLWKQLQDRSITGIGPVKDLPSGRREFVVTDPDGNSIRVGSPAPQD
jgi:catechol 2,3-dioxygenase-like lactoylglutathione lyase family enzyme